MEKKSIQISTSFSAGEQDSIRVKKLNTAFDDVRSYITKLYDNAHTSGMPDEYGENTDHDKRYVTKSRLFRLVGGSPYGVTKLVSPDGSPDPAVSVANDGDVFFATLSQSRLVATNTSRELESVQYLTSWIAGTTNRVTVSDDGDGTVTLSIPQDYHTSATPQLARLGLGTPADSNILLIGSTSYNGEAARVLNDSLTTGQSLSIGIGQQVATGKISQMVHYIDSSGVHQTWVGPNGYSLRLTETPTMDYAGTVFLTDNRTDDTDKALSVRGYQWDSATETEGFTVFYAVST